jgi:hypothetical protein
LRLPVMDVNEIDTLVLRRPIQTSRHHWLLEAVHEKIMREKIERREDRRRPGRELQ